jgi:hypothetical protein
MRLSGSAPPAEQGDVEGCRHTKRLTPDPTAFESFILARKLPPEAPAPPRGPAPEAKILVANRGEIAIRVMRAANELGKKHRRGLRRGGQAGLHRFKADEAYKIGEGLGRSPPICRSTRSSASPSCAAPTRSIPAMACCPKTPISSMPATPPASPSSARRPRPCARSATRPARASVAIEAGVPVVPRPRCCPTTWADRRMADEIGYPVMLKASWGGGGRGMRPIYGPDELEDQGHSKAGARPRPPSAMARAISKR